MCEMSSVRNKLRWKKVAQMSLESGGGHRTCRLSPGPNIGIGTLFLNIRQCPVPSTRPPIASELTPSPVQYPHRHPTSHHYPQLSTTVHFDCKSPLMIPAQDFDQHNPTAGATAELASSATGNALFFFHISNQTN
uniref:Uncharacterized protein n=1 Tax=Globodera pallida TaxID=36090 RepID=A0A183BRM6_GLOPA